MRTAAKRLGSCVSLLWLAGAAAAFEGAPWPVERIVLPEAQIVLLGEIHDNEKHHLQQAAALRAMAPAAVVFEMLDAAQAETLASSGLTGRALSETLNWEASGWPDFELYEPVLDAARSAQVYGMAVPPAQISAVLEGRMADVFGDGAARFGLDIALPADEQAAREEAQFEAHCDALPREMLPGMVDAQRFRDASFARVILQALEDTGGPVAVIAGNGHVRNDWGLPVYLKRAAPDVTVLSVGQIEVRGPLPTNLPYDVWMLAPVADREDPCAIFDR